MRVVSLDLSSGYLRQAASNDPAGPLVCGDAAFLPFRNGSFRRVLATEVLEHTPDPDAVVAELARVLAPGGNAVLTCPSGRSYMDRMYRVKRWIHHFAFNEHLREFSPESFTAMLRRHMDVLSVTYANCIVPFPLDLAMMHVPSRFAGVLDHLEGFLRHTRAASSYAWTMIARCGKSPPMKTRSDSPRLEAFDEGSPGRSHTDGR